MRFIGQHHIMNQLKKLLPNLDRDKKMGANILLKGPSGFGKTLMAHSICKYLSGTSYEFYLAEDRKFEFNSRVIFVDEVHKVPDLERFYPLLDENSHVFVFATNHDSVLPEAFINRCTWEFIFDDYDEEELSLIAWETCQFSPSYAQVLEIVRAGNGNPRIIKSICKKLNVYFNESSIKNSPELDFSKLISDFLRIDDGLDTLCKRYIETLKSAGGTASFNLIKTILHVDEGSLKDSVEPVLIKKGIIKITSKGRSLV